jgi:putative endonuclease
MSLRGGVIDDEAIFAFMKMYYVYIMTNWNNEVLYIGVTNDIARRAFEHKEKLVEGFTKKYNISKLVYVESCEDVRDAIAREKQLKGGSRKKKIDLIIADNPEWIDLSDTL